MSSQLARAARRVDHELRGVVVSAGLMQKTVKVRVGAQKWNKVVHKYFADPQHYLVHDANSSLRTGDVVAIMPGWPTSRHKRHVVKRIIAPYGVPIDKRPQIPSLTELIAEREAAKAAHDERRAARLQEEEDARQEDIKRVSKKKAKAKRKEEMGFRAEPEKTFVEGSAP